MRADEQPPIAETSLSHYFEGRLSEFAEQLEPAPHADTRWYLGNLLVRFCRSEHLFSYEEERYALRPLALLYGDAREASSDRERCLLLQQLGDMALFLGALFPELFSRRGIRRDYVVGMGGGAYDYLAENARHGRHIFSELARTFPRMLQMVAHAGARRSELGVDEVMALYQRWLEQRDPLVASQLQSIGIDLSGSPSLQ